MPAGYADKMETVISNIPMLVIMLILVIPVAILGMRLAEKAMKKQTAKLNEKLNPPAMLGRLEEDVSGMRK